MLLDANGLRECLRHRAKCDNAYRVARVRLGQADRLLAIEGDAVDIQSLDGCFAEIRLRRCAPSHCAIWKAAFPGELIEVSRSDDAASGAVLAHEHDRRL